MLLAAGTVLLTLSVWPIALSGRRAPPGLWLLGPWIVVVAASGLQLLEYVELANTLPGMPLASRWQTGIGGIRGAVGVAMAGWMSSGLLLLLGGVLTLVAARIVGGRGEAPENRPLLQTAGALQVTLGVLALSVGAIQGARITTLNRLQWDPFDTTDRLAEVVSVLGGSMPCCGAPLFLVFGVVTGLSALRHQSRDEWRALVLAGTMALPVMGLYGASEWMLRRAVDDARGPEEMITKRMVDQGFDMPRISWGQAGQAFPELSLWPDGELRLNGDIVVAAGGLPAALDNELGADTGAARSWQTVNLRIHAPTPWRDVAPVVRTLSNEGIRSIGLLAQDTSGQTTRIMAAVDPVASGLSRLDVHRDGWTYMGQNIWTLSDFEAFSNVMPASHDVLDVHVDPDASWKSVVEGVGMLQQQTWFSEVRIVVEP